MTRSLLHVALGLLLLGALSCSEAFVDDAEPDMGTHEAGLRVPGPWVMPQATAAKAATQYVPVVNAPPVSPRGSCSSSNPFTCSCRHPECAQAHPGTRALDQYLRQRFPSLRSGGLFCCRQNSARTSVPMLSVHAIGRAIDLMVPLDGGDANNGIGDPVANWLVENAEFVGIQRVVWDKAFWNGERGYGLLGSSSSPHVDHLHIELSHAGAAMQTPFFTSGAYMGNCAARCEGTRIINADCSSGDCAYYGATCTPGNPPRCTQPPPPEPAQAERNGSARLPGVAAQVAPGRVNFVTPTRLADTRAASPAIRRAGGATSGPLREGANTLTVTGVPDAASAAWLNVAAVLPEEPGFMTLYPAGAAKPATSSLNYQPDTVRSNAIPVGLSVNDQVTLDALRDVDAVVDMTAYFAPTGQGLSASNPTRVLDTRSSDAPIPAEAVTELDVRAPAGATGVLAMLAVINRGELPGFLTAFPCGEPTPATSNVNYGADSVTANTALVGLPSSGRLCVWSKEEVHLVVDVQGYVTPDGPLSYQPLTPTRVLDTRDDDALYRNRLAARQTVALPIQALDGMPEGVWAVAANVTAVGASNPGFLAAYPCGGSVPATSSVNFPPDSAVASLATSSVGMNGELCVFASSRAHVIVDVVGVWKHIDGLQPPPAPVQSNDGDLGDFIDPDDPGVGGEDAGGPGEPDAGGGGGTGADAGATSGDAGAPLRRNPNQATGEGCASAGARAPTPPASLLGLLVVFMIRVRRRRQAALTVGSTR